MPTISKTPSSSIEIKTRLKNTTERTTADIWAGASIIDASWNVYQDIPQNKVTLNAGQEGVITLRDTIKPDLQPGNYFITVALWDRDPSKTGAKELARDTSWVLSIQTLFEEPKASIISVDVS